jgi:hypothetical protein
MYKQQRRSEIELRAVRPQPHEKWFTTLKIGTKREPVAGVKAFCLHSRDAGPPASEIYNRGAETASASGASRFAKHDTCSLMRSRNNFLNLLYVDSQN